MSRRRGEIPPPERVLSILKDFQRDTVDYVFRRLYLDDDHTRRFLVADEVGLGKTMVARGVIARTLDLLRDREEVDRIDVIYVCSNGAIAQQNVRRLNVTGADQPSISSRLSLLPLHVRELDRNEVNFVSLTPNTSFHPTSRGGTRDERLLLWAILKQSLPGELHQGLGNAMQCTMSRRHWRAHLASFDPHIDGGLADRFRAEVESDPQLLRDLAEISRRFHDFRETDEIPHDDSHLRYDTIAQLRALMARVCVRALEPDLIILDEFQRFADLLQGDSEAALLTREFLNYRESSGHHARTLMLSATPYRMLSLHGEAEDHYADFVQTCRFLFDGDDAQVEALEQDLTEYRRSLLESSRGLRGADRARAARDRIEARLRRVMVRTERVPETRDRSAMLRTVEQELPLAPPDLGQMRIADRLSRIVGGQDVVEYWKSSPYLLNLMKAYKLKQQIRDAIDISHPAVHAVLDDHRDDLLQKERIERYEDIDPANPRMRALLDRTVESGLWKLLWIPPSQPYLTPNGTYAEVEPGLTKHLIFSTWSVVPDAIAGLCSYEAERRMVEDAPNRPSYSELSTAVSSPLRFVVSQGRFQGQYALLLLYPSPTLAALGDPLSICTDGESLPVDPTVARGRVLERIRGALEEIEPWVRRDETVYEESLPDQTWYWKSLARMDMDTGVGRWVGARGGWRAAVDRASDGDEAGGLERHIAHFADGFDATWMPASGPPPDDLAEVLTTLAMGAPGSCALRALHRTVPDLSLSDRRLLTAAARVAEAFRTLFDLPETYLLIRGRDDRRYWEAVARYCIDGNLQAVLDEYVHVLIESLGLVDADPDTRLKTLADELTEVLSLRTTRLAVDDVRPSRRSTNVQIERFNLRSRFAFRFGDLQGDSDAKVTRADTVRSAFNSPFRPFVLASTSVGQEGLDFHLYCHAVHHWNLPTNPVDLEQREGRVHRYKSHAVRKNVAENYGAALPTRHRGLGDPWADMFGRAVADRPDDANDLVPFWIYENGSTRIERHIPMLLLSREVTRSQQLVRSLATYRMAFGQPRQEDLVRLLGSVELGVNDMTGGWEISLRPPRTMYPEIRTRETLTGAPGTLGERRVDPAVEGASESWSDRGDYRALWTRVRKRLIDAGARIDLPDPTAMNQMRIDYPAGRVVLGYSFTNAELSVWLLFRGDDPAARFERCAQEWSAWNDRLGLDFEWKNLADPSQGHAILRVAYDGDTGDPDLERRVGHALSVTTDLFSEPRPGTLADALRRDTAESEDAGAAAPSPRRAQYGRYWAGLLERSAALGVMTHAGRDRGGDSWLAAGAGRAGLTWVHLIWIRDRAGIELYINSRDAAENLRIFHALEAHRDEVESAFGDTLDWQTMDGSQACRVRFEFPCGGIDAEHEWPEIHERAARYMGRFADALGPFIDHLDRD